MSRIYLPYPLEILTKIISWAAIILIDLLKFVLAPFMRVGVKCFAIYTLIAAVFSGYMYFHYDLIIREALTMLGLQIVAFIAFICLIRVINHLLVKKVRPPFAKIVFEPVAVSFRRPCRIKRIRIS